MGMRVSDDNLENILFYGADSSVRLGILPEEMLAVMRAKGFLTESYIRASYLFHSKRDFEEAARVLSRSLSASRFRIRNVRLLSRIYLRAGKFLEALEALKMVPESRLMRDSGLLVMKIKALRGTRNHDEANSLHQKLRKMDDEYGDIAVYAASRDLRAGQYASALKSVELAKRAPRANQAVLSILQCACEVESGNAENLGVTCALARALGRDSDAWQLQARAALVTSDWKSAEDYISRVKRKDWFDLNVEYRVIQAKKNSPGILRDPVQLAEAKNREEELLRDLGGAVEGISFT
jgi:tetratricopeptide (TPR) repeat protein